MQICIIELQRRIAQLVNEKEQIIKSIPKDIRAAQSAKDAKVKALQEQLQSLSKEKQGLQNQCETLQAQVSLHSVHIYVLV